MTNLYEYTDRALLIQASTTPDGFGLPQQITVPGKILVMLGKDGRVETGLGYWEKPRDGMLIYLPTHLGTGGSICGSFASEHMARVFLEEIAEKVDWSLPTQLALIEAYGDASMKELIGSARTLAMQTTDVGVAEQVVLKVVRGLRRRTDVAEYCDELVEVADLLASLRFQQQQEKLGK